MSLRRKLGAILALLLLLFFAWFHAVILAHESVDMLLPDWDVQYGSIWWRPWGGAWINDVVIRPYDSEDDQEYAFDRVTVDVPFFQFYRSLHSMTLNNPLKKIKKVDIEFAGGHGKAAMPFTMETFMFGNASAAPFESEGCAEDNVWYSDELADMGLGAEPTTLRVSWSVEDDRLVEEQSVHTPGVGRMDYRGEHQLLDAETLFDLDESDYSHPLSSEWHIRDEGFVEARNRYCSSKDGISIPQFAQRHLASVQRLLAAVGLKAGDATVAAYRQYAEHGSPLDLILNYTSVSANTQLDEENLGNWLPYISAELVVDERSQSLGMQPIDVRPFPENSELGTTYSLIEYEAAAIARKRQEAADLLTEASQPAKANAKPDAGRKVVATETVSVSTLAEAEALFAEQEEKPAASANRIVDYRKLVGEVGQSFIVHVKGKKPMRVEVMGSENGVVQVRRYQRSGWLEHGLVRSGFEYADRVR